MPSPAAIASQALPVVWPRRTPCPRRWPMARRGVVRLRLAAAGRVEPGALHAGEIAREVGDRCDHRRPDLGARLVARRASIVAARMKSQARGAGQDGDVAVAKISFGKRAVDRLRHGEQTAGGVRRVGRSNGTSRVEEPRPAGRRTCPCSLVSRGRRRKARASSRTSAKRVRPRLRAIRSRRSPCWPMAASVHLPAAPLPYSEPCSRTNRLRPGVLATSPTSQ